jgi:hypothetical protein
MRFRKAGIIGVGVDACGAVVPIRPRGRLIDQRELVG